MAIQVPVCGQGEEAHLRVVSGGGSGARARTARRRRTGEEGGKGRLVHSGYWSTGPLPRLLQALPLQHRPQRLMGERRHTANVIDIGLAVIDGFLIPPD